MGSEMCIRDRESSPTTDGQTFTPFAPFFHFGDSGLVRSLGERHQKRREMRNTISSVVKATRAIITSTRDAIKSAIASIPSMRIGSAYEEDLAMN